MLATAYLEIFKEFEFTPKREFVRHSIEVIQIIKTAKRL